MEMDRWQLWRPEAGPIDSISKMRLTFKEKINTLRKGLV